MIHTAPWGRIDLLKLADWRGGRLVTREFHYTSWITRWKNFVYKIIITKRAQFSLKYNMKNMKRKFLARHSKTEQRDLFDSLGIISCAYDENYFSSPVLSRFFQLDSNAKNLIFPSWMCHVFNNIVGIVKVVHGIEHLWDNVNLCLLVVYPYAFSFSGSASISSLLRFTLPALARSILNRKDSHSFSLN